MTSQHGGLSPERWAEFDFGRQILMIANELHRAAKLLSPADAARRRSSLERVYALVDLTIATNARPARRRELLRWREILGESYLASPPEPASDHALLRALLRFEAGAAAQIPFVAG